MILKNKMADLLMWWKHASLYKINQDLLNLLNTLFRQIFMHLFLKNNIQSQGSIHVQTKTYGNEQLGPKLKD